jgi:putative Mg2+ transporter-C (MgtC) family protein
MPVDLVWRLLLATVLGAAVGFEREYRQKPAGLRTNILIALGSALFTILSIAMGHDSGTADRIAAQIVTGIGFLGGGAILRSGNTVHGMTTAATIWVNAAIGVAAGMGQYALATVTAALTLIVLAVLPPIEAYFERRAGWTDGHRPPDL